MAHSISSASLRTRHILFAALVSVLLAAVLSVAVPAMAHPTSITLPGEGHGGVHTGHTYVYACDDKANGLGVRTYYWLRSGGTGAVGDANGSAGGCGGRTVTQTSNPVVYYEVCAGPNGSDRFCTSRRTA